MHEVTAPLWARELGRFIPIKPQFVLWGNIYDVYPFPCEGGVTTLRLQEYLNRTLTDLGYGLLLSWEPIYGFSLHKGDPELGKRMTGETFRPGESWPCTLTRCAELIEKLLTSNEGHGAVVINFSSRIPDITGNDMHEFYYRMFRLAQTAVPKMLPGGGQPRHHCIIWILDKENDLPPWYTINNPKIHTMAVPLPDFAARRAVAVTLSKSLAGFGELTVEQQEKSNSLFIDQTSGLHTAEIVSIVSLARREEIPFSRISDAIRLYKLGVPENPWAKLDLKKIAGADQLLQERVKGQQSAVQRASDIMKRAVFNLSGAQYARHSQRPKGVLFLAGPTGVGKTELAKAITELLFGSDTSCIRFDMSEFAREHADQRLVGAPPGYVGYDVGGELTNAVRQNPFSVLLFDEIEKAHPRILDIFLQILDDGRLTSGRGETVYFSETLIIFTSNLGIFETTADGVRRARVSPSMPYDEIRSKVMEAISSFFTYQISRPEILNRIGENIVVFDFIREQVAREIFKKMLQNVLYALTDQYRISVTFEEAAIQRLFEACCAELSMGGRGIGNKLEEVFVNPLSRLMFQLEATAGDRIHLLELRQEEGSWSLTAARQPALLSKSD
jgi:DNA polymerase III delta prime subunit